MKNMFVLAVVVMCSIFLVSFASDDASGNLPSTLWQIKSDQPEVREAAVAAIVNFRNQAIEEAEMIIRGFDGQDANRKIVKDAILLLGRLECQHSIPLLADRLTFFVIIVENVTFAKVRAGYRGPALESVYPCVQALIDIGLPSIDPLVEKVKSDDDKTVILCAGKVIETVLGKDSAVEYLMWKMSKEDDEVKKTRLFRLVEHISADQ